MRLLNGCHGDNVRTDQYCHCVFFHVMNGLLFIDQPYQWLDILTSKVFEGK